MPHCEYTIPAMSGISATHLKSMQKAQNAAVGKSYFLTFLVLSTSLPCYKRLQWLKIQELLELKIATITHSILKNEKSSYLLRDYLCFVIKNSQPKYKECS